MAEKTANSNQNPLFIVGCQLLKGMNILYAMLEMVAEHQIVFSSEVQEMGWVDSSGVSVQNLVLQHFLHSASEIYSAQNEC